MKNKCYRVKFENGATISLHPGIAANEEEAAQHAIEQIQLITGVPKDKIVKVSSVEAFDFYQTNSSSPDVSGRA